MILGFYLPTLDGPVTADEAAMAACWNQDYAGLRIEPHISLSKHQVHDARQKRSTDSSF
jgi:hypothetical protein